MGGMWTVQCRKVFCWDGFPMLPDSRIARVVRQGERLGPVRAFFVSERATVIESGTEWFIVWKDGLRFALPEEDRAVDM